MSIVGGSCLCSAVAWLATGPLEFMSHCHCSRCRKAHGAAFATYVLAQPGALRVTRGREHIGAYESSSGLRRPFCRTCGSVVPDPEPWQGLVGLPAGPLDDDPGARPMAHIFVGSKAPWFAVRGALPSFDAYPPGFEGAALDDLPAAVPHAGRPRGSCLCGGVAYVMEGTPTRAYNCHCTRCRKARGAAHASNLFTAADGVRFVRGEELLQSYKLPAARFFAQVFCRTCGSLMPRIDRDRDLAVIPMGSLDDDPGLHPQRHIFVASKAPWYDIPDGLPQHDEYPPRA